MLHQCWGSEHARKHNWSDKRISIAENAIALRLNVMISAAHGKEAQMLRIGFGGDVVGLSLDLLHQDQLHAVCNKYPRCGLKREMRANLKKEQELRPDSRIAFLCSSLGFHQRINHAPMFQE